MTNPDGSAFSLSPAGDYFSRAAESFTAATRRVPQLVRRLRIADRSIELRFAGDALVPTLTPAFAHASSEGVEPPDLTIGLWDGASTGVAPPHPSWRDAGVAGNGELRELSTADVQAAFDVELGMLNLYDATRRSALFWLRSASDVPITLVGTPLRIILQWWASRAGRQLVHAAAVGNEQGGVLIAGASGAGKSTTALTCLLAGMRFAGDDFVLVEADPSPFVYGLYGSAKIDRESLAARFPGLLPRVASRRKLAGEKEILFVNAQYPERMSEGFPLRAIVAPRLTGERDSRLIAVSPAVALRALLPGVFPIPGACHDWVTRLGSLARRLPAFRLDLGTDPEPIPAVLASLCREAHAAHA